MWAHSCLRIWPGTRSRSRKTRCKMAQEIRAPTSTAEKLDFSVALGEDVPPGTYSVCYCSGQSDGNLALLGDAGGPLRELHGHSAHGPAAHGPRLQRQVRQ